MKILATADIHGSQYRLNIVLKNVERYSPDLVVICGDITQFGPGELAKNFLDQIPVETLALTGNIDTPDVSKGIDESKATKIEMKKVSWSSRQELIDSTLVVIVSVLILALFIGLCDYFLSKFVRMLIG